ncbi:MAG: hypothetical protein AB1656_11505 [Candidatus Omnitrophota bacterium]
MTAQKTIEALAEGQGRDILDEIKQEIDAVKLFLRQIPHKIDFMTMESESSIEQMESIWKKSEAIAYAMNESMIKINAIEKQPWMKQINQMKYEIHQSDSSLSAARLQRDIRYMESLNSNTLSKLATYKKQLLIERLSLTRNWKMILSMEIHLLEKSKEGLLKIIAENAQAAGDLSILEMAQEKLKAQANNGKIDLILQQKTPPLELDNIHVLRTVLEQQLGDLERIEKTIAEKKVVLQALCEIIATFERQISGNAVYNPVILEGESEKEKREILSNKKVEDSRSASRMAYRKKL